MKLAALLLTFLAAKVRAGGGDTDDVISIHGDFFNECYNTEVIDVGAAGIEKWTVFTYCPTDRVYPGLELLSTDLDECIVNEHGSLKWRDQ